MTPRITRRHLIIGPLPENTSSIDVCFDGTRVWSIDVRGHRAGHETTFDWPASLQPYLSGSTHISVLDSATRDELESAEVTFRGGISTDTAPVDLLPAEIQSADVQPSEVGPGNAAPNSAAPNATTPGDNMPGDDMPRDNTERTRVVDDVGRPLAVNKWGRLGIDLASMGDDVRRLIIERSALIIDQLRELGVRPFVVGGTLLGAVRSGALLPHDDDADIAYLSEHTKPINVGAEAFRIGRQLESLGYEIKRHSATHMQLLFRDDQGTVVHYIDVFAAFFSADGLINQPFHVRGKMSRQQMLPFSTVEIDGVDFPAPADVDRWLTINYDENWRTPIPGYELVTPIETRRRFDNWFGSFNLHRDFWDEFHHEAPGSAEHAHRDPTSTRATEAEWSLGREWLLDQHETSQVRTIVDLGCGGGLLTRALAAAHMEQRVIGLDYSGEALWRAEHPHPADPESGFESGSPSAPVLEAIPGYESGSDQYGVQIPTQPVLQNSAQASVQSSVQTSLQTSAQNSVHPPAQASALGSGLGSAESPAPDPAPNISYGRINLYRARSLAVPQELGIEGPFDVVANHLMEQIGHHGRMYAWRIMRMSLRTGGAVSFTFHAHHARRVTFDDPTGWHLTKVELRDEARRFGLEVDFTPLQEQSADDDTSTGPIALAQGLAQGIWQHSRQPTGVTVRLATQTVGKDAASSDRM